MRALSLPVVLIAIAVVWCVAVAAVHGWMSLLYPAAWLVIAVLFFGLNKLYDMKQPK